MDDTQPKRGPGRPRGTTPALTNAEKQARYRKTHAADLEDIAALIEALERACERGRSRRLFRDCPDALDGPREQIKHLIEVLNESRIIATKKESNDDAA
jgi:hypothetical protein